MLRASLRPPPSFFVWHTVRSSQFRWFRQICLTKGRYGDEIVRSWLISLMIAVLTVLPGCVRIELSGRGIIRGSTTRHRIKPVTHLTNGKLGDIDMTKVSLLAIGMVMILVLVNLGPTIAGWFFGGPGRSAPVTFASQGPTINTLEQLAEVSTVRVHISDVPHCR